jgi:hypothetical protein
MALRPAAHTSSHPKTTRALSRSTTHVSVFAIADRDLVFPAQDMGDASAGSQSLPRYGSAHYNERHQLIRLFRMALAVGTLLGPYEIVGAIDAGSMDDVYKERGTRLDWTLPIMTSVVAREQVW